MKRLLKILIGLAVAFVLVLVIAGIAFKILVDPDNLKARVTTLVKEQTGRDLTINGDLNLTFFPWVGFGIEDTVLKNPPGFTDEAMLSFESANASVRLLPLMSKQIEVGTLNLKGLNISLETKADGTTNWDDLLALGATEETAPAEVPTEPDEGGGMTFNPTSLGGVRIEGANVRWRDGQAGSDYRISNLDFVTGSIAAGEAVPVELSFDAVSESPQVNFKASLDTTFFPEAANSYRFDATELKVEGQGETLPGESLGLSLTADSGSWKGEDATVVNPKIAVNVSNDESLGDAGIEINADQLVHKVQTGLARFDGPTAKITASKLGADVDIRATNIASRLSTQSLQIVNLNAEGTLNMSGNGADPVKLTAKEFLAVVSRETLDIKEGYAEVFGMKVSTSINGSGILSKPKLAGSLNVAEFSPREVMTGLGLEIPETSDPEVLKKAALSTNLGATENGAAMRDLKITLDDTTISGSVVLRDIANNIMDVDLAIDQLNADRYLPPAAEEEAATTEEATPFPTDPLKNRTLNGKLTIGEFIVSNIRATDVNLGVNIRNSQFRLYPATATMYGGSYNGDLKFNVSGSKPLLSMDQKLSNIQLSPFSKDMIDSERIQGTAQGSVVMSGTGVDVEELKRTISGDINFNVTDGALDGIDLWYELQRVLALANQGAQPQTDTKKTAFKSLQGDAVLQNGVMSTNNMVADVDFANVKVRGDVNLPEDKLDLLIEATMTKVPQTATDAEQEGFRTLSCATLPIKVGGTTAAPRLLPDVGKIGEVLIKCKAQEAIDEKKEELKDKARDKVKDKLKDIFGG